MSLSNCIAKRSADSKLQSFEGHSLDALSIFKEYLLENQEFLKTFSINFDIDFSDLCNLISIAIYLHDLGKLTKEFQENISKGIPCGHISHAFFGLPYINSDLPLELNNLLKLVILSHHSQLYNDIFQEAKLKDAVSYLKAEIQEYMLKFGQVYATYFSGMFSLRYKPLYQEKVYLNQLILKRNILRKELRGLRNSCKKDVKTKALYCLVLAILKDCDQKSSAYFDRKSVAFPLKKIQGAIINLTSENEMSVPELFRSSERYLNETYDLYDYQKSAGEVTSNCILSAPCGRGKTEAALLAALNLARRNNKNRIIFALPTQVTSNAMFERLKCIFGESNVGIYHGMSRFVFSRDAVSEEVPNFQQYNEKVFLKPVIVTTVDHLVYSLVHGYKQADFALGNLLNSVIIFDEIHYYETHTLEYILDCFELLRTLNVPHIAMSGTLPEFIRAQFKTGGYALIEDREGMSYEPFIFQIESQSIFEKLNGVKDLYQKERNQIVIVNTVKRAQDIYRYLKSKLPSAEIHLLHSQFTFNDRRDKEAGLAKLKKTRPWIIVATQVIEISIDISSDVMHTELAPIDAIGQRGGRLNRKGTSHDGSHFLHIYPPEDHKPYFVEKPMLGQTDFVERTLNVIEDGPVSYSKIKDLCDSVYNEIHLKKTNLKMVFLECTLFGRNPWEIRGLGEAGSGNLIRLRDDSYPTIDVIPEQYWQKCKNNPKLADCHKVKIPLWWYSSGKYADQFHIEKGDYDTYIRCTIPYSKDYGFDLESKESTEIY